MYMHDHPNRHYVFVRLSVQICLYASLCTRHIQSQSTCFKPPACFCHTVISKKTLNSCLVRSNASTTDTGPKGARYHRESFSHYSPGCDTMPTDLASAKESMAAKARARNAETPCTWSQPTFAGKKRCQNASKKNDGQPAGVWNQHLVLDKGPIRMRDLQQLLVPTAKRLNPTTTVRGNRGRMISCFQKR